MERLPVVMHLPALTVLGRVRVRMNKPGGNELLNRALEEGLPTGETQRILPVRLALAEAAWLDGDLDEAREQIGLLADLDSSNTRNWDYSELAVWRKRLGVSGEPPAFQTGPWTTELKGDLSGAAAEWQRLGLPYEAALVLLQVEGAEAAAALGRAVELLDAIEARKAAVLARRRAQERGLTSALPKSRRGPYAMARRHPLGLTSSEQQVLEMMAEGRSNKDIARQLDRSPRTVEHQVSAVLGKFSARNRIDVMLRLRNEPWLLAAAATQPEGSILGGGVEA
jgi:DNA-binding CsgD family transcriptional regulator